MFRKILRAKLIALCLFASVVAHAQSAEDAIRVTLALNPDGTKTTYETNAANHRCVATTTDAHGKTRGKIIYRLDADGRYESGDVFAANGAFRFHTLYHYNAAGQLAEETQLDKAARSCTKLFTVSTPKAIRAVTRSATARARCSGTRLRKIPRRARPRIAEFFPRTKTPLLCSLGKILSSLASAANRRYEVNA
ncbi:MAG TPA: hypothetical protein VGG02_11805 [Chthoniobacterales bacterium]